MAQLIHCDGTDCPELATVMVSTIANGDTLAWCDGHYVAMCQAIAEAIAAQEAEETDTDAIARLDRLAAPPPFPTSPESSGEGAADPGQPGRPARGRARSGTGSDATPEPNAAPGPSEAATEDAIA